MLGTGFDSIHNGNRQEWRQFLTHLSSCHCSYCAFSEAVPWEHCMGTDSYNKTLELPLKQDCSHLMLSLHTAPYLSCSFLPQACSPRKEFAFSLLKHLDEFQQGWQPTFWADRLQQTPLPPHFCNGSDKSRRCSLYTTKCSPCSLLRDYR